MSHAPETQGATTVWSGVAGFAVVQRDERWVSIQPDGEEAPASPALARHLLANYPDAVLEQDTEDPSEVLLRVRAGVFNQRALSLMLSLLDSEYSDELRIDSARLLESRLLDVELIHFLRRRLLGAPAPADADLSGALTLALQSGFRQVQVLLRDARAIQPALAALTASVDVPLSSLDELGSQLQARETLLSSDTLFRLAPIVASASPPTADDALIDLATELQERLPNAAAVLDGWMAKARHRLGVVSVGGGRARSSDWDVAPQRARVQVPRTTRHAIRGARLADSQAKAEDRRDPAIGLAKLVGRHAEAKSELDEVDQANRVRHQLQRREIDAPSNFFGRRAAGPRFITSVGTAKQAVNRPKKSKPANRSKKSKPVKD